MLELTKSVQWFKREWFFGKVDTNELRPLLVIRFSDLNFRFRCDQSSEEKVFKNRSSASVVIVTYAGKSQPSLHYTSLSIFLRKYH